MTVQLDQLPPDVRQRIEELMRANDWDFNTAMNQVFEAAVASGALSVVGRRKAKVLQLVAPMRDSPRDSSG
ncbi:hypothetical protein AAH995_04095 [Pseudomonas putida]|uniref:hypothetical protein n=1 Tax=Pseudomonas putida TaxID=303 RepID=UPI00349F04CA